MATASPTPMPSANGLARRTSQRQALRRPPSRQALTRSESQPGPATSKSQQYHDDSSEDEIPVPMKLSAFTKALLNDGAPEPAQRPPSPPRTRRRTSALNASVSSSSDTGRHLRSGSVQASAAPAQSGRSSRPASPTRSREGSPARKRVIRLSSNSQSLSQMQPTKRRSTSLSRSTQRPRPTSRNGSRELSADEKPEPQADLNTPAQAVRVVRIAAGSSGKKGRMGSAGTSSGRSNYDRSAVDKSGLELDSEPLEPPETVARNAPPVNLGSVSRYPSSSLRGRPEDNPNLQSSMRVKRVGKIPGSFLSGPARRGRRRQSEEDADANGELDQHIASQDPDSQPAEEPHASSIYADGIREFNSGSPVSGSAAARAIHRRQLSNADLRHGSARSSPRDRYQEPAAAEDAQPQVQHSRADIPSAHDQENEVPASYRRPKPSIDDILEKIPRRPMSTDVGSLAKAVSPERKPLASIANNTPRRAAPPPPPKMSIVDTATSAAGASTTSQAKQRRNILKVNGKCYTRLDCLGRGGSAKVYRVVAENGKSFALKRVSLEHADESTIRGFKGEIDLLRRLSNVTRVINLMDYEMNEEKKMLTMVMEMGELDFNILMKERQSSEYAKLDVVFVRLYWKEMLECLQAVHQHDVVHSDLKPANFVLVKGQLKLIDFGIANAIQTEETVNVHRETQIGTPNYMSPESLMDSNQQSGSRLPGRPKLMKLGKPSDVWSLGCILYQMVYGVPPFGHIATPLGKCQAIINWDHVIEFPSRGMGGVLVPPSLIRTMKRCLNRDQHMRPTCEELLYDTDPFLYPMELGDKALPMDEEMLGRIIQSVVTRCRERMPTEAESMSVWPQAYWTSVKKAMAGRM
ncbi:kinase-like domain-containing protein [Stachybotrys elegans]|uniref:Kinase-like domain-containing protein n=1 Tax=Stachybotrys elegans TaxID=80388 RepID=A0A8K0SZ34_9HYPO|nr:kinase-like domain-containing protein [Stachybotrys elegans]